MRIRNDRPENRNGRRHFVNALEFKIAIGRTEELKSYLNGMGLKFQRNVRFSFVKFSHAEAHGNGYYTRSPTLIEEAIISFSDAKALTLFKLAWVECVPSLKAYPKVILPVIRRVMPKIIAHDIIGVSPMTGPVDSVFSLRVRSDSSSGNEPGE